MDSKKDLPRVHFITIFVIINPIRNQDQQKRIRCSRCTRVRLSGERSNILQSECFRILISGVFLGLAIFTKVPMIIMIPLVAYLEYKSNRSIAFLGLWLIPVILIPLIWPMYAILAGDLEEWISGISWQLSRVNNSFLDSLYSIFLIDPALAIVSALGIAFRSTKGIF